MRLTENLTTLTWQIHNDSGVNVAVLKCNGANHSR